MGGFHKIKCLFLIFSLIHAPLANAFSPYTTDELDSLEKEFIQIINQSPQIERNPLAKQYLNATGKKLSQYANIYIPSFFIVLSPEINAFAGPGGYIGINSQLILASENESELAAVMAHEIAHVHLHHLYNMIAHEKQMKIPMLALLLASAALGAINPTLGTGALMASMSGLNQNSINFTRSQEKEADRIGIDMLIKAGFDPRGMINFFKKMQQNSRYYYTANIPPILRSHPMDEERITEAEYRSTKIQSSYAVNPEYYLVKEIIRVAMIQDSQKLHEYYRVACPKHSEKNICLYGQALGYLHNNQFQNAKNNLQNLVLEEPNNIFYNIAMAQAETGLKEYNNAFERLQNLLIQSPDNYALIMAQGENLMAANQPNKAMFVLLKGSRLYPKDLPLCHTLAQAQSNSNQKSHAYFTRAQCLLLEGKSGASLAQLKVAKQLAKKDNYMLSRIEAKIEEIKQFRED